MSETTEHSPSLRDAIEAAYSSGGTPSASEPGVSTPEATDTSPDNGPARGPDGKFASRAAEGAPEGAETPSSGAPDGWTPELWAQLTPDAQRTASEYAVKARETLAEREARLKGYEPIERALASRRDALAAQFGSAEGAVEQLFQLSDWASRDPVAFIRHLAQQRGLTPEQVFGQMQTQQPGAGMEQDPRQFVAQLVQEQLLQERTNRDYQEFMAMTGLQHRANPEVTRVMVGLLQAGAANDYQQAYAMAVQAHPVIGPKLRSAEAEGAAKADAERRAQDAASKASAAVSVTGAPGTSRPPAPAASASLRGEIERAFESASSGRV